MAYALDLWPVMFWGFWAYPFIAIQHMRRQRLILDLARIASDKPVVTFEEAIEALSAFQAKLRAEIAAEEAAIRNLPPQTEGGQP